MIEFFEHQRKPASELTANLMDLAMWSNGAVSYSELKSMSPEELKIVSQRIQEYLKNKAKAMGAKDQL